MKVLAGVGKIIAAMFVVPIIMALVFLVLGAIGLLVVAPQIVIPLMIVVSIISLPGILVGMCMRSSKSK